MCVSEAQPMLEDEGSKGAPRQTLASKPRDVVGRMLYLDWEADGAVISRTHAFALTGLAMRSLIQDVERPPPLAPLLIAMPGQYTRFNDTHGRVLQSLVNSGVSRHANRIVQCLVFLAQKLGRIDAQLPYKKQTVKLYEQRVSVTPLLQMPQRIDGCAVRFMNTGKTCAAAAKLRSSSVTRRTWHEGPWTLAHLISRYVTTGSHLNDSLVEVWAEQNTKSATGLAVW